MVLSATASASPAANEAYREFKNEPIKSQAQQSRFIDKIGPKPTSFAHEGVSATRGKADMTGTSCHFRVCPWLCENSQPAMILASNRRET